MATESIPLAEQPARVSAPVSLSERIATLDVLRGAAVLGILLMNIQFFSMPGAAYSNPTAYGDLSGINFVAYAFAYLFAEMKFISMFSLLFGAGIALMLMRAESKGVARPGWLHLRRMWWLFVFGMIHAYVFWPGDILVTYAICGVIFFAARKWRPRTLLTVGIVLITFGSLLSFANGFSLPYWPKEALDGMRESWAPGQKELAEEIAAYGGTWLEQMPRRAQDAFFLQLPLLFIFSLWRVGGMMLIGMALLKSGFLRGDASTSRYWTLAFLGTSAGLALSAIGLWQNAAHGWAMEYSFFFGSQWSYWGSFFLALGYISWGILAVRNGWFSGLQRRLASVGRMAFSNYILETLICTTVFYGHGFGLYGQADRWLQTLIVLAVWAVILVISPWWLSRNAYGPLEYLWRRLTYGSGRVSRAIPEAVPGS